MIASAVQWAERIKCGKRIASPQDGGSLDHPSGFRSSSVRVANELAPLPVLRFEVFNIAQFMDGCLE